MESDQKISPSFPPAPPSNGVTSAFPRSRPMHGRTTGPTRRSTKGQWTPEEDEILRKAVQRYKGKNWKKIAECFKDRTDVQCLHRWQKVLNPELVKGPWSKEEDEVIVQLVDKYGPKKWSTIAQHLPGRIGKQCRERWHNHLNPAINKDAWTQEEELVLIRAHQIHGNRWAELTKYLPGRTDNSIKNHWNSSVKKKLDSYIASGLLTQFQGLPLATHQTPHQSMSTPPLHHVIPPHGSGDGGSVCKDGNLEDNSEDCSQVGCSQTTSDMSYTTACQTTREDSLLPDESDYGKVQQTATSPSLAGSHSVVPYSTSLDDITFTIPDIPYEFTCPSTYHLEENFSKEPHSYMPTDGSNFGTITLPSVSCMDLASDSSNLGHVFSYQPTGYDNNCGSSFLGNDLVMAPAPVQKQKPRKASSRAIAENCSTLSTFIDMDGYRERLNFESVFPLSGAGGTIALQSSCNPLDTNQGEPSDSQNLATVPLEDSGGNDLVTCTKDLNQIQLNDCLGVSQVQEDTANSDSAEQTDLKESLRLVPVNSFTPETSDSSNQTVGPSVAQQTAECKSEEDQGSLCYEPPRFPSLDIPFFSCDLAQSGTDALQDYSPLGIRQLMMSSMNSLTPFKLWDSPTSSSGGEKSPDAVLKSAAKTFACTPSILKKRHRDLLSPLSPFSERRYDKKTGSDVAKQGFLCTSRLTKEFSRLDVMFDEAGQCKQESLPSPLDDEKENIRPPEQGRTAGLKCDLDKGDKLSEEEEEKKNDMEEDTNNEGALEHGSMPRGVLIERPLNDTGFSSPDGTGPKTAQKSSDEGSTDISNKGPPLREPGTADNKAKENKGPIPPSVSAAASTEMVDSLISEIGAENLNIFGGTPFRRSIESPSAWKSPWYFSSLVTCPRFDTDITVEDIGIFMSPGLRSVDALGLMKQINEQSADAFADAREVLGSETPESIMKQRTVNPEKLDLAERRVLDFSECGTPAKAAEKGKCGAEGLSSPPAPPACLLKSYR